MPPILLPADFLSRLELIIPHENLAGVVDSFSCPPPLCVRINTLKSLMPAVVDRLIQDKISLHPLFFCKEAFLFENIDKKALSDYPLIQEGMLYQQAPSSLLPACVLAPKSGDRVLDACAAPGSKTTQMAAAMQGCGEIQALDVVKPRFFKLKSVCSLLGARNVVCRLMDARRFRCPEEHRFDAVLVDAPCSSEGRFKTYDKKSLGYWSIRKIKEMSHKQKGILLNAARALKPGGRLVYSTCTFSPEENEEVVDWFLKKTDNNFLLEPFMIDGVQRYPVLKEWNGREYQHDLSACWRVLPDHVLSGFFIAAFRRREDKP